MGAAFEVNKQMCDIGRLISVEEMAERYNKQISQSRLDGLSAWLKLQDMEEKKTKKMTKAEAFEYLKGKKVLCKYYDKMEAVQGFVKSLGFHWSDYSEEPMLASILFLGEDERLTFSVSLKRFEEHEYEEISADDILSIEIVDKKNELELNYDKVIELAKPLMHYLSETGHTEVISVCKEGISAIPMGTFLYKG